MSMVSEEVVWATASSCRADSIIMPMNELPDSVYSVAAVREIDRTAIEDAGIPGYTLMTRAGAAATTGSEYQRKSCDTEK